ncbi:MAG TPA: malonate transporter subunit MadL [Planctomycetaceae bacterium]|jgi:malonate transporter MadL subunit|nr:malonate transporter subunit MadL [Planctomycetaceae bacterium]
MVIYGTALLAACLLLGSLLGRSLGWLLGLDSDLGGVGIAMLLLIGSLSLLRKRQWLPAATESGIQYWNLLYVPIVVAMAASQNVIGALAGGLTAAAAGLIPVAACCLLTRLLVRCSSSEQTP